MKNTILFLLLSYSLNIQAQELPSFNERLINLHEVTDSNENFEGFEALKPLLKDAEIVMLGEQSHADATAFDTKIKLIKYLHEEMDFDILAFESGFYNCKFIWDEIENGKSVDVAMGRGIYFLWSFTKELLPLSAYLEQNLKSDNPLLIMGFDSKFTGQRIYEYFFSDTKQYLNIVDPSIIKSPEWAHFEETIDHLLKFQVKEFKKRNVENDTTFINTLISKIDLLEQDKNNLFWKQTLKNCKYFLSDMAFNTDNRDKHMAENLIWIKEQNPGKKIICWGATSHFLYNSTSVKIKNPIINIMGGNYKDYTTMGSYLKEKYGKKLYTIGFIAYEGTAGINSQHRKIKTAKEGTLEHLIAQAGYENCLLPFNGLLLPGYISRPLSYYYMKTDITTVMDAAIFNRNMRGSEFDDDLIKRIYAPGACIKPGDDSMLIEQ